ncbi:uncharacterized protein [Apostichopus japonicus]|uniref:uncharacterized protein n=1 Tax=Stichopus japonicus TaxID=307972 RepID=UPI003AB7A119
MKPSIYRVRGDGEPFHLYDLPDTIPVGSIPLSLRARNVKVWNFSESIRRLNLQTGRWQASDIRGRLPGEEGYEGPVPLEEDTDEEVCDNDGKLPGEEGFDEESYQKSLAWLNSLQKACSSGVAHH